MKWGGGSAAQPRRRGRLVSLTLAPPPLRGPLPIAWGGEVCVLKRDLAVVVAVQIADLDRDLAWAVIGRDAGQQGGLHRFAQGGLLLLGSAAEDAQVAVDHGLFRRAVGDDQVFAAHDARLAGGQGGADHLDTEAMDLQRQGAPVGRVEMGGVFQRNLWHSGRPSCVAPPYRPATMIAMNGLLRRCPLAPSPWSPLS